MRKTARLYAIPIHRVLKQVHPLLGLSGAAQQVVHDFVVNVLFDVLELVDGLLEKAGRSVVSSRDIQSAIRLLLVTPGNQLVKHVISEATKSVTNFNASTAGLSVRRLLTTEDPFTEEPPAEVPLVQGDPPARPPRPRRLTLSARRGLTFPITRTRRIMKQHLRRPVGDFAATYLASVLEALAAEVLELSGNQAQAASQKRISPRHVFLAIRGDEEFKEVFGRSVVGGAGGASRMILSQDEPPQTAAHLPLVPTPLAPALQKVHGI